MIPSFTSVNPKTASGEATTMSAQAARPEPPPSAKPCTRHTTGAGHESIAWSIASSRPASSTFSSKERSIDARCHSTSAPAQKLGPSPARTTARASPTSANASVSSAISAASNALRRSGFASVTRSTAPSRSIRSALMRPPGPRRGSSTARSISSGVIASGGAMRKQFALDPARTMFIESPRSRHSAVTAAPSSFAGSRVSGP